MKVHISGFATVIGSKKYPVALKEKALAPSAPNKIKALQVTITDDEGNSLTFVTPMQLSKGGSLMSCLTLKGEAHVVEVEAKPDGEAVTAERVRTLEAELLGS